MVELETLTRKEPGKSRKKVICNSCAGLGIFSALGPNNAPAWLCLNYPACDSYVGCHPGTENALGTLANAELRAARVKAHGWIDRLWRGKKSPTRKDIYQVIGQAIGVRHFHVAQSDMQLLDRLNARRADLERAFGRVTKPVPAAAPANTEGQGVCAAALGLSLDAPPQTDSIASDIDAAFVEALFLTSSPP